MLELDMSWARYHVGDIVTIGAGFGWFDGDPKWVSNLDRLGMFSTPGWLPNRNPEHGNCFVECCTYKFFWVVTFVDPDTHNWVGDFTRPRYHLYTKAMVSGRAGYTFDQYHHTPKRVVDPPKYVVDMSKDVLGLRATHLTT